MRKGFIAIGLLVVLGSLLIGCQKSSHYAVAVEMTEHAEERKDDDGTVLLSLTGNYPIVSVKGNTDAERKINQFIEELVASTDKQADEDEALAKDDRAMWIENMGEFNGYGLGSEFTTERADSQVVSFRQDIYEFTGGAHPNSGALGFNFSTQTGNLLTLKDVVSDEAAAKAFIADTILAQSKDKQYEGMFFDDYEESVKDVFSDSAWYFSEDGFTVICNEYVLGPHASGIIEFVIPYEQFELLDDSYYLRSIKE